MRDVPPEWEDFFAEMGLAPPPPPPGYGVGTAAPEWFVPDTFTGRRYQLWRLRSVLWQRLQQKLATGR